jgi:hypothetical protein
MGEHKWVRTSLRHLSTELGKVGHKAAPTTVGRLLRKLDYSLKANVKRLSGPPHPDREPQFDYIEALKGAFLEAGLPVISVDSKKKELIGNFQNLGRSWCREPEEVNVHDFLQDAVGKAVPYGIYDLSHNLGYVYVGNSAETGQFAVDAIAMWWEGEGRDKFCGADKLLVLADGGGGNGYRSRLWKQQLQEQVADRLGLDVTVCHYPTGASKWNPVEHRLFGPISINWAGKPLRSFETMLSYIRGTTTEGGLKVKAYLLDRHYAKGVKVTERQMKALELERHDVCPNWNYTLRPRSMAYALT